MKLCRSDTVRGCNDVHIVNGFLFFFFIGLRCTFICNCLSFFTWGFVICSNGLLLNTECYFCTIHCTKGAHPHVDCSNKNILYCSFWLRFILNVCLLKFNFKSQTLTSLSSQQVTNENVLIIKSDRCVSVRHCWPPELKH